MVPWNRATSGQVATFSIVWALARSLKNHWKKLKIDYTIGPAIADKSEGDFSGFSKFSVRFRFHVFADPSQSVAGLSNVLLIRHHHGPGRRGVNV